MPVLSPRDVDSDECSLLSSVNSSLFDSPKPLSERNTFTPSPSATNTKLSFATPVESENAHPTSLAERNHTLRTSPPKSSPPQSGSNVEMDDLMLARMLQEQENAWQFTHTHIPRQRSRHENELDRAFVRSESATLGPADAARTELDDDEALARQLMMEEEQAFQLRLQQMAGVVHADEADSLEEGDRESLDEQDEGELDPDSMTYEQLCALGDAVGTHSRGVSGELLQTLPIVRYSIAPEVANGSVAAPKCAVCYMEFEEGDEQLLLPCKHTYHPECIQPWLKDNNSCPTCKQDIEIKA